MAWVDDEARGLEEGGEVQLLIDVMMRREGE